jgi:hypothetical protein
MALTAAGLVAAASALAPTGVTTKLAYYPLSLQSANLPVMWVGVPKLDCFTDSLSHGISVTITLDITIAVKPIVQDTAGVGYASNIAIMDALQTALNAWTYPNLYDFTWSITSGVVMFGQDAFHSVTASLKMTEMQG